MFNDRPLSCKWMYLRSINNLENVTKVSKILMTIWRFMITGNPINWNRSYQFDTSCCCCCFKSMPKFVSHYCSKSDQCEMHFLRFRFDIKSIWLIYLIIVFSSYVFDQVWNFLVCLKSCLYYYFNCFYFVVRCYMLVHTTGTGYTNAYIHYLQ